MSLRILYNGVHGTRVQIRLDDDHYRNMTDSEVWDSLLRSASLGSSPAQRKVRRIEKALCGMTDCCCETVS